MPTSEIAKESHRCPSCGAQLQANVNFCWLCGAPVRALQSPESGQPNLLGKIVLGLAIAGLVIAALQIALLTLCFVAIR
jgi:hypothetical protein